MSEPTSEQTKREPLLRKYYADHEGRLVPYADQSDDSEWAYDEDRAVVMWADVRDKITSGELRVVRFVEIRKDNTCSWCGEWLFIEDDNGQEVDPVYNFCPGCGSQIRP
jgi:hypothetical protein